MVDLVGRGKELLFRNIYMDGGGTWFVLRAGPLLLPDIEVMTV